MERPIFKPIGTPVAQLDTPALVVDLALVEHNIATLHAFFQQREAKVRPHVTAHRCPALAHKQLAAAPWAALASLRWARRKCLPTMVLTIFCGQ